MAVILDSAGLENANIDRIVNNTSSWPTNDMGELKRFEYVLAIGSDESLMNRLKRVETVETVYTGLRKSGGGNWKSSPDWIYQDLEQILKRPS